MPEIIIFLNNGGQAKVDTSNMRPANVHILAKQISACDLVHTTRVQQSKFERPTDFVGGEQVR